MSGEEERRPIEIIRVEEPFAVAYLADGSKVRVKIVFTEAARVFIDGKPAFLPNGEPKYHARFEFVIAADVPKDMMQKVPHGKEKS